MTDPTLPRERAAAVLEELGLEAVTTMLRGWLPRQRWFAGKGRPIRGVGVVHAVELVRGGGHPVPVAAQAAAGAGAGRPAASPIAPASRGSRGSDGSPAVTAPGRGTQSAGASAGATAREDSATSGAGMLHLVLRVAYEDAGELPEEHYQLLLGISARPSERLAHAEIGRVRGGPRDGAALYDAAHDARLTAWLLERFAAAGADDPGVPAPLAFHRTEAAAPRTDLGGLVINAEQSNTSIVFGDDAILKLFRRLTPGTNPDLEIQLALARAGSRWTPRPIAWFAMPFAGSDTTLGVLQQYLRTATDGWELAKTSVRDLYADSQLLGPAPGGTAPGGAPHAGEVGGDFAGESFRLGVATAEVHADLARTLATGVAGEEELIELAALMAMRLDRAVRVAPQLRPYADRLREAYTDLARLGRTGWTTPVQRIHGDYHLGQVMRTSTRWVLIDFEGEPAQPLSERRALHSPMRDVAAMLRSFDYAARHLLTESRYSRTGPAPHLVTRAEEWATRNRDAFCAGYADAGGMDPRREPVLLRAFETDKAVYEVVYETGNRPSWVGVPMSAIRRLAESTPLAPQA